MSTKDLSVRESSGSLQVQSNVELTASDIELGKLLLIQQTKPQGFEDAKFGDIHETVLGQKVGGLETPVEIIPVQTQKFWRVWDPKEKKVLAMIPASVQNADLRMESEYEGKPAQYFHVYRFFVLLAKDIKEGGGMPYIVDFKSTSHGAGKRINTQLLDNKMKGKDTLSGRVIKVGAMKTTQNGNTYAVFTAMPSRDTSKEELEMAKGWQSMLSGKQAVVEDELE